MLGTLRSTWAPEAFIVSFKLETDEQILISKVTCVHFPSLVLRSKNKLEMLLQTPALFTALSCWCRLQGPLKTIMFMQW